jgi:hypothetical protein
LGIDTAGTLSRRPVNADFAKSAGESVFASDSEQDDIALSSSELSAVKFGSPPILMKTALTGCQDGIPAVSILILYSQSAALMRQDHQKGG